MVPAIKIGSIDHKKIAKQIQVDSLSHQYGQYHNGEFYGIRYFNVKNDIQEYYLNNILPENLRLKFSVFLMVINYHEIPPHRDADVGTVINYYIKSSNATTYFWNLKQDNEEKYKNGFIFQKKELNKIFDFTAKDNDLWILDVNQIHSVSKADNERMALCFQTELSYTEIVEEFKNITL